MFGAGGHLERDASGGIRMERDNTPDTATGRWRQAWTGVRTAVDYGAPAAGIAFGGPAAWAMAGWGLYRTGQEAYAHYQHGQSFNPLTNEGARALELNALAFGMSGLTVGARLFGIGRPATVASLNLGAGAANTAAVVNSGADALRNWSQMNGAQRALAALEFGFFGRQSIRHTAGGYNALRGALAIQRARTAFSDIGTRLKELPPAEARAYVENLRANQSPEMQRELLAHVIAAEDSPARTEALRAFGEDYAGLPSFREFTRPGGTAAAETPDERLALGYILAQNPRMTPKDLLRVQEWAMLGDAVFAADPGSPDRIPPNYERVTDFSQDPRLRRFSRESFENTETGFRAELYRNKDTGQYVLAIRGTRFTSWADWKSNAQQNAGMEDKQYLQAMRLGRELKRALRGRFAGVTGQSKGGGQAAAVAMVTGRPAITFNAAGLNPRTVENAHGTYSGENIQNWRVGGPVYGHETLTHLQENAPLTRRARPGQEPEGEEPASGAMWPAAGDTQIDMLPIGPDGKIIERINPIGIQGLQNHRPFAVLNSTLAVRGAKPRSLWGPGPEGKP